MSDKVKLQIIVPEVHDGLGGVHKAGDVVSLPADIAAVFIEKNCAVLAGDVSFDEAKRHADVTVTERTAQAQAERAKSVMDNHDNLSPAQRHDAYYRGEPWEKESSSITTLTPEPAPGSKVTAMEPTPTPEASPSIPPVTASPSSTTTSSSSAAPAGSTGKATSGSKRIYRK